MLNFKPMLAVDCGDLSDVRFPVLASPKLDGIRLTVLPGRGALTRSLKPLPNAYARRQLEAHPELAWLDGELIVGSATDAKAFNTTTSGVMSRDGEPDFQFHVFDIVSHPGLPNQTALDRSDALKALAPGLPSFVRIVEQVLIHTVEELLAYEEKCLTAGYEGVMLKDPGGKYKFGRSTRKEGWLLKLKRFSDIEATIIDVEEQMENANEAKINALGYTERSSCKGGLIPKGTLGALIVRSPAFQSDFGVGTGFDQKTRDWLWAQRDQLFGQQVKIKFFSGGVLTDAEGRKIAPRFPVYLGLRDAHDL